MMIEVQKPPFCQADVTSSAFSDVYLMDCIEGMKHYPDKYFDLAVVDPPYGISVNMNMGRRKGMGTKHTNKNWDNTAPLGEYFTELFRVSQNQIIWGGNYFDLPPSRCFIIWDKKTPEDLSFAMCEFAWTSFDKVAKIFRKPIQTDNNNRIHPTQKPIPLYDWIFQNYATEGMKIIDTHLGSGSSRISANKYKLNFVGFEIDEEYFNKQEKRYADFASQTRLF
jgi:site-specific DNA-methyltransferase (adenine-specific)